MDKKGFIELGDISPMAIGLGLVGAIVGYYTSYKTGAGIFWTILSTVGAGVVGFLVAQKMSDG